MKQKIYFNILKIISAIAILTFLFVAVALPVFAANEPIKFVPLAPLPGQTGGEVNLGGYFVSMYKFIIGAAGVLAVLMIVIAGVEYMSPMPSSKESGKNRALAAIFGLLLALVSYLILNTINPDLVNFKLNISETTTTSTK